MSRKPVPAHSGERSRVDVLFDKPQLLSQLFGQYDQNLVALENRLGVYITARGNRIGLEGTAEQVAMARDVLNDLYARIQRGEEVDTGLVDAAIAMAAEPTLDGIVSAERAPAPSVMIRTRKKTIVPRTPAQAHYMRELTTHDMIFALGPAGTGKTYIAVAQAVAQMAVITPVSRRTSWVRWSVRVFMTRPPVRPRRRSRRGWGGGGSRGPARWAGTGRSGRRVRRCRGR